MDDKAIESKTRVILRVLKLLREGIPSNKNMYFVVPSFGNRPEQIFEIVNDMEENNG